MCCEPGHSCWARDCVHVSDSAAHSNNGYAAPAGFLVGTRTLFAKHTKCHIISASSQDASTSLLCPRVGEAETYAGAPCLVWLAAMEHDTAFISR